MKVNSRLIKEENTLEMPLKATFYSKYTPNIDKVHSRLQGLRKKYLEFLVGVKSIEFRRKLKKTFFDQKKK